LTSTLEVLRRWLMVALVIGVVGTGIELLLLKHTEGFWQLAPVGLLGLSLAIVAWYGVAKSRAALRALQGVMALFVLSGGIGAIQHFRGNIVYERESNPSLSGTELYKSAMMGSTPALAPGAMLQLGLIGLLYTFRHPGLGRSTRDEDHPS
jgi:hypothetical protein